MTAFPLIPLLFVIGALVGALASGVLRVRVHRARFNNVVAGILGALLGGLWLSSGTDAVSLLVGAVMAVVLVALLAGARRRLTRSA